MGLMRNPNAPHIDFTDLNGVYKNYVPSNIDMMYERNGYFLVGEWKRPNESISIGQSILLKQLAKQPRFIVLIIQGNTDAGMHIDEFWLLKSDGSKKSLGKSLESLRNFIHRFFKEIADK
jgi:hypothetical protein